MLAGTAPDASPEPRGRARGAPQLGGAPHDHHQASTVWGQRETGGGGPQTIGLPQRAFRPKEGAGSCRGQPCTQERGGETQEQGRCIRFALRRRDQNKGDGPYGTHAIFERRSNGFLRLKDGQAAGVSCVIYVLSNPRVQQQPSYVIRVLQYPGMAASPRSETLSSTER